MGRRREGVKKYLHTYPIQTAKENKQENQRGENNSVTKPILDLEHTLKYPSDGDEDI